MADVQTHKGSCHCGATEYEVDMSLDGLVECNCSHCYSKGLVLGFVQPGAFRLNKGEDDQTEYRFNSHKIGHNFCPTCGVQAFARGEAPDGSKMVAINVRTLSDIEPFSWIARRVDGRNR